MSINHLYPNDFPEKHKVKELDIVTLYHEGRFDELDTTVICKDSSGNVTATFVQNNWNCMPFSRRKSKNNLVIDEFDSAPKLQRELKFLIYGWLFNKSPKRRKAISFSSVSSRLKDIKIAYRFLADRKYTSLQALSKPLVWQAFTEHLVDNKYVISTIEKCFASINNAVEYSAWHKINLGFTKKVESKSLARELNTIEKQQTLVIPERLCNAIYGKAIELVEQAHLHRELIEETESALQNNYLKGKQLLDKKVKNGQKFSFMLDDGSINTNKYSNAIIDNQPQSSADIVAPLAQKIPSAKISHGINFKRYLGQLITASYIICGGFSGMRESEIDKLTPNSYYKDNYKGRDYHMLQSRTFKLGEKRETWVTAHSSKIAIELMSALTKRWRTKDHPDKKYNNSLWVNQFSRSRLPILIVDWPMRLKRFCKHFNLIVTQEDYQECLDSNPRSQEKIKKAIRVGKPWPLTSHQFRRTLAFYCIKNRLGTLVALKQQFKHLYLAMTEWYTNGGRLASLRDLKVDEKIQKTLDEISAETTTNKIFKQWHSDETLSGTHGKAIMKMREDVPIIYSSWDVIYKAVKEGNLTLHGSLHSYCKSGYDCDMDGIVTPQFCVDCGSGSSIIDEQQAKWWRKKHRSLVAYMESGEDISVSEHSHYVTQVRAAEKVMADFDMPFTPFEPDLKVANL